MASDLTTVSDRLQGLWHGLLERLPLLVIGLVVFIVLRIAAGFVRRWIAALAERAGQGHGVSQVIGRLGYWVMLALGLMLAATIIFPTLNAASVFGALGVGSVAIGFAFKDIFRNLLAGVLLLLTRPFSIGDQIVSGTHESTVEDIQIRSTRLRTYDNRLVIIPNADLYTNRVVVNTAKDKRRVSVTVGIGFGDDIARAKQLIMETVATLPDLLHEPPVEVLVRELGDCSVNLEIRFWIDPPRRHELLEAQDVVLQALKGALQGGGLRCRPPGGAAAGPDRERRAGRLLRPLDQRRRGTVRQSRTARPRHAAGRGCTDVPCQAVGRRLAERRALPDVGAGCLVT